MQKIFTLIFILSLNLFAQSEDQRRAPLEVAKLIADRVIRETRFELTEINQKPALDLQVLDFTKVYKNSSSGSAAAFSRVNVKKDTTLSFGISTLVPVRVWINSRMVYEDQGNTKLHFKEIAYSVFSFQDTITASLRRGENSILIEASIAGKPLVFLREITRGEEKPESMFLNPFKEITSSSPWLFCELSSDRGMDSLLFKSLFNPDKKLKASFSGYPVQKVKKTLILPASTFKKDSFADWNYPNGILMMVMNNLSLAAQDGKYKDFLKRYCGFIRENLPPARRQYYEDHEIRGMFHRIFRKSMLDDAGAPALPFIDLALSESTSRGDSLISEMVHYVYDEQLRLPDGTFCRYEPEEGTVWADDMFMSVPLLLRAGLLYKDNRYTEEAVKQALNFRQYLFDESKKLYKHGCFSRSLRTSEVYWGRANGWVLWAASEVLLLLPKDNPSYKVIEQNFISHLEGILALQGKNGLWHQVLDDENSFEETSCSAMFITALARGIINGSVSKSKAENIFRAWNALLSKIDSTGTVSDICCGTGIGRTKEFYLSRERFDNDPRGLGAVITAAIEVDRLNKFLRGIK